MTSVYETAVSVISKPPELRTEDEIRSLMFWFRKKSDIFRNLTTDVVTDIVRNCDFSTVERDSIVIKQGDKGDCFYIILRGLFSIHINTDLTGDEDDVTKAADKYIVPVYNEKGELDRSKFGNYIAKLEAGDSFGELALINKNCVRNASIVADEKSDLLVVNRELYDRSLKAAQTAELEERNEFVRNHPLFRNWSYKHRKQMCYSLKKEQVSFNEFIVKQGDNANVLNFLLRGQAKVLMEPSQHETQYSQFYPLQDPDEILIQEAMNTNDGLPVRQIKKDIPAELLPENQLTFPPSALRKKDRPRKVVEVSVVAGVEIIGDAEFSLDLKTYLQSAVCTQACEVYSLTMKNYERLVSKRNPKTADLLRQQAAQRLTCRLERLHDSQVPLLRSLLFKMQQMDKERNRWKFQASINNTRHSSEDMFNTKRKSEKKNHGTKHQPHHSKGHPKVQLSKTLYGFGFSRGLGGGQPEIRALSSADDEPDAVFLTKKKHSRQKQGHRASYTDWATSDTVLTVLEDRIRGWHNAVMEDKQQKLGRKEVLQPVKMRRFKLERGKQLKPASRVIFKTHARNKFVNSDGIFQVADDLDIPDGHEISRPGKALPPLHTAGIQRSETSPLHSREADDVIVCRDVLNTQAFSPPFVSGPRSRPYVIATSIPDDETGTIIDVMRRRQNYILERIHTLCNCSSYGLPEDMPEVTTLDACTNKPTKTPKRMPRNSTSVDLFPKFHRLLSVTPRSLSYTQSCVHKEALPDISDQGIYQYQRPDVIKVRPSKPLTLVKPESILSVLADEACFYKVLKSARNGPIHIN